MQKGILAVKRELGSYKKPDSQILALTGVQTAELGETKICIFLLFCGRGQNLN